MYSHTQKSSPALSCYKKSIRRHELTLKAVIADPSKQKINDHQRSVVTLTITLIENKRSRFADLKVAGRNILDPATENFFEWDAYGHCTIVWNVRKLGGKGRFNRKRLREHVPKNLSILLKNWYESYGQGSYLFFQQDEVKQHYVPRTPKTYNTMIADVGKQLEGRKINQSDIRRCQITFMGIPNTEEELEELALKFHHTPTEHRKYFRTDAQAANGNEESAAE